MLFSSVLPDQSVALFLYLIMLLYETTLQMLEVKFFGHQLNLFYANSNTVKTVILWNIFEVFLFEYILKCNLFLWCKAEFSASLLQPSASHDPSEIILLPIFLVMNRMFKQLHLFDSNIICNIMVSFDLLNASFLNISIIKKYVQSNNVECVNFKLITDDYHPWKVCQPIRM